VGIAREYTFGLDKINAKIKVKAVSNDSIFVSLLAQLLCDLTYAIFLNANDYC
jgi:hypothetical protein